MRRPQWWSGCPQALLGKSTGSPRHDIGRLEGGLRYTIDLDAIFLIGRLPASFAIVPK
jgi:hypothetical protein